MLENESHYIAIRTKLENLKRNINSYLTNSKKNPDAKTLFLIEKSIENDLQQITEIYSEVEIKVPTNEDGTDLGLIEMLLDMTKEDLTEEEVIESLKLELTKRS